LVKVETTKYRDQATGQHRRGHNLYVLLVPWPVVATLRFKVLRATPKPAVTSPDDAAVALGKQERALSLEGKGELEGLTGVSADEAPPGPGWFACISCGFRVESPGADLAVTVELPNGQTVNSYHHHGCGGIFRELAAGLLDAGQHEPSWEDLELTRSQVLERLQGQLGPVEVLAVWDNDQLPPRSVRRWRTVEESPRRRRRRKPKEKP
jgi:hypothetical protein